MLGQTE